MSKDIFISYSTKDTQIAVKAYEYLENNNVSCWMAPRDIKTSDNYAKEIMSALVSAKIILLIYSMDSQKSHYVLEEIDNAFSRDKTILPFKIDDVVPEDKMEFYLRQNQWLDASSNPESFLDDLVKNANRLCMGVESQKVKKPVKQIKINDSGKNNYSGLKNKLIVASLLVIVFLSGFMLVEGVRNDSDEDYIVIDYIGLDNDTLKGYSWKYSYFVFGSSSESASPDDIVHIEFIDGAGNTVKSNDVRIGDIQENILASAYLDEDNITEISVKLFDENKKQIFSTQNNNIINQ